MKGFQLSYTKAVTIMGINRYEKDVEIPPGKEEETIVISVKSNSSTMQ